ncbi:MAG: hypothetical protein HY645_01435 [Acidobacteria bacterium]|nr:hypothetical protein [Acidobacteriota bacterium]
MSNLERGVWLLLILTVFLSSRGLAQESPLMSPLSPSVKTCQTCHPAHYEQWQQSYHSKSMVSIQAGFKKFITTQEQKKGRALNRNELMACVGCHAPAMRFAADEAFARLAHLVKTDQKQALENLSVDCISCHSLVVNGHSDQKPPQKIADYVFHSTIQNPLKTVHGNKYAAHMANSDFCKSCHTYVTPADMKISADWDIVCSLTFDAWAEGPHGLKAKAADQKQCQSCHMEKTKGKAAAIGRTSLPVRELSSHLFPGWHSSEALQKAAVITLDSKRDRKTGAAEIVVTIENRAGHRIPDT